MSTIWFSAEQSRLRLADLRGAGTADHRAGRARRRRGPWVIRRAGGRPAVPGARGVAGCDDRGRCLPV